QVNKRQVAFYKSKTSQEWDLLKFLEAIELNEHKNTIFPVQVSATTEQPIPPNQHSFHYYDYSIQQTSYFYRTSEKLVSHTSQPILIKKNYRLGTRNTAINKIMSQIVFDCAEIRKKELI
ncbi:19296_t:CDS:2, partial [Gigaspora rosea]